MTAEEITELRASGEQRRKELSVWWALKGCLARALESLVLWDRVLFLRRAGMRVELIALFDAILSPRQYALVAYRDGLA